MKDEELEKICLEIYKEHQTALDLIYEYKPNYLQKIAESVKSFLKTNKEKYGLIFNEKDCSGKSYIRFVTKYIDEKVPHDNNKDYGWHNGRGLMYEIEILQKKPVVCIATISNSKNKTCENIFNHVQNNKKNFNVSPRKLNEWSRVFKSKPILGKEAIESLSFGEINEKLESGLKELFKKEIPEFEGKIKECLDKKMEI